MLIYLREFARNRKQFIVWTSTLVLCSILMMAFFPYMAANAKTYNEVASKFPKAVVEALGANRLDFSRILDYYVYMLPYLMLFGGMYAAFLGAGILSKEEDEGTIEFLLAKPVTRPGIITPKLLNVVSYLILFNIIFALCNFAAIEVFKGSSPYSFKAFLLISAGFLLFQLVYAAVGLLISVFVTRSKTVNPIALGIVFGTYFFSIAAAVTDKLKGLNYFTPFKFFNPVDIICNVRLDGVYIAIAAAVIILSSAAVYVFYKRKDIMV